MIQFHKTMADYFNIHTHVSVHPESEIRSLAPEELSTDNHSFYASVGIHPWALTEENTADASILISVPKKRFKHAVKRNQVKRQVREAYRHHKYILLDALKAKETPTKMILAFIWLDNKIHSTEEVEYKVKKLLVHIAENI